jgi:HD-GYP domain-containing protein (c-di-GMP phosphodiesterase class II)
MATTAESIELSELVGALSFALDLTEGQPAGHSLRGCWIGMHVGAAIGLGPAELSDLYYTLLLKDVGCSSNAARICSLFVTDDLIFKRDSKALESGRAEQIHFALAHMGKGGTFTDRLRAMVNMAVNGGGISRELIDVRCHRGADVVRQMRFSETVARGILDLDEHWNGKGQPEGRAGTAISLFARIALLAQVVDVFHTRSGHRAALAEARHRAGSWFDPALVAALEQVGADPGFWVALRQPDIGGAVMALEPKGIARPVDDDYLDAVAAGFAQVVDAKSPFTSGHSDRVALFADLIAEELALDGPRRRWLRRAALLHDIGKLGVSNAVLDKPGKLDEVEWAAIKLHPALGETILSRITAFRDLAVIAGAHHERLDGKGYPRGLAAAEIGLDTRIVTAADIFDALTADRPYRARMPVAKAIEIMRDGVGTSIDPDCLAALERAMEKVERIAEQRAA